MNHMISDNSYSQKQAACHILQWYQSIGVTEVLADSTTNWFAQAEMHHLHIPTLQRAQSAHKQKQEDQAKRGAPSPKNQASTAHSGQLRFTHTPKDDAVMEARNLAASASSLDELETILRSFNGCALKNTAKNICISRGNPEAPLMLIGEAPGRDEDIQGRPFVGRAGQLLDKMLSAIQYDEATSYITNIVYWRPPGNRPPTPEEAQICRPFLERQIELVAPKAILFLGGAAAKNMLNTNEGIMRLRGKWKNYTQKEMNYKAMATLHPAYLLRNPAGKRLAWQDFLNVKLSFADTV